MNVTQFWWARAKHGLRKFHAVSGGIAGWEPVVAQCGVALNRDSYLGSRTDLDKIPEDAHACPACLKKIREL